MKSSVASPSTIEPAPDAQPFTVAEVAALMRVSTKTVAAGAARGEIPGRFTVGRCVLFRRPEILAWLTTGAKARAGRGGR